MNRPFMAALAVLATSASLAALWGTGCNSTGVGDPCVPEAEYLQSFTGFSVEEVNIESKSFQCQTRLCLANHFQGRVTCPYGQDPSGGRSPPADAGCVIPGINLPVTGMVDGGYVDPAPTAQAAVQPQCITRTPTNAVYCSCRCQNENGQTNDGANYCTCPDGFKCTQLVSSVGGNGNQGLTGGYCIKKGTRVRPGGQSQQRLQHVLRFDDRQLRVGTGRQGALTRAALGRRAELAVADYLVAHWASTFWRATSGWARSSSTSWRAKATSWWSWRCERVGPGRTRAPSRASRRRSELASCGRSNVSGSKRRRGGRTSNAFASMPPR